MKQRIDRLARLAQQTTGRPPESPVEDVRIFDYSGVGSVWLGRFDHDIMMASLAVLPEPPAEDEVDGQDGPRE
jgi:hypothetical protein